MNILSVFDEEFYHYGKVVQGYDTEALFEKLAKLPCPQGVAYVASEPVLENLAIFSTISNNFYGGMPTQLGWCNGHNTKLNCLEYHRDSELNFGTDDFILLLAQLNEINNDNLHTNKVKAFHCPKGTLINIFSTTLHYAPCSARFGEAFHVLVALPKATNTKKPDVKMLNHEDKLLYARNKWLLAHKDSSEAAQGAFVGLIGDNIDIASLI